MSRKRKIPSVHPFRAALIHIQGHEVSEHEQKTDTPPGRGANLELTGQT